MNSKTRKAFIFVLFLFLVPFLGVTRSMAQSAFYTDGDENSSGKHTDEDQSGDVVNQVHDLAVKMKENEKRLDALEKAVDQTSTQTDTPSDKEGSAQEVPAQEVPVQATVPAQVEAPVQQPPAKPAAPVHVLPPKENQFKLTTDFSHTTYKEPGVSMQEKGPFYGIYGAYDFRPQDVLWPINVFHFDSDFNVGSIKYTSPDGLAKNIRDYMVEPRIWVGRDIPLVSNARVTPYGGIGYRYLLDHLGAVSSVGGYDRRSQYLYVPTGLEIDTQAIEGWELGLDSEYDSFIRGWQTSYLSEVNPLLPDLNNIQIHGYGLRASLDIIKKMDKYNVLISPYIKYWHIKQSNTETVTKINGDEIVYLWGYEPDNNSTEIGMRLGVEF